MVVAVVALAAIIAGCHKKADDSRAVRAVRVESIEAVGGQGLSSYSGTALAQTQVDLSFKVGGYVESIASVKDAKGRARPIQAGDRVEKGMVLMSLGDNDYRAKQAELAGMRNEASSSYVRAKADFDRAATLMASGSISKADFDNNKGRFGSAAGAAAAANARLAEATIALSDTRLKSPLDGIVLTRALEVGALAAPGTFALSIADTQTMRVIFGVPDSVQRGLTVDQNVMVTADGVPGRLFSGTITKLAVQADPKTRLFDVEATLDNADQAIKVGMVMQVRLDLHASDAPAALVPLSAIVRPPDVPTGFAVYVTSHDGSGTDAADVAHLRVIKLGGLVANRVTVTEGLSIGDKVVVQGATLLADGQRVNIVP